MIKVFKRGKLSVNDIMDLSGDDISYMDRETATEYLKKANKASKFRRARALKALEGTDMPMPTAYKDWNDVNSDKRKYNNYRDYDFSFTPTEETSVNEIKYRLRIARDFLNTKTSKISGWKDTLKDFKKRIEQTANTHISENEYGLIWKLYNTLEDEVGSMEVYGGSDKVQQVVFESVHPLKGISYEDIDDDNRINLLNFIKGKLKSQYVKIQDESEVDDLDVFGFDHAFSRGKKS